MRENVDFPDGGDRHLLVASGRIYPGLSVAGYQRRRPGLLMCTTAPFGKVDAVSAPAHARRRPLQPGLLKSLEQQGYGPDKDCGGLDSIVAQASR